MPIKSGTKLGPYEILAPVGAGGMGEVYRAKDTRLNRIVAIKVLPSHLSANSQLKQRFEREAQAVSSLSHPHICALYDIGQENGTAYLVMEFLEGETLAQRLDKGSLPTEQTLRYGIQIAEALDKAHRQGIVHRDLKPGNIIITKSGAKLLDFGLAKYKELTTSSPGASVLETRDNRPLTEEGMVLGTVQYMAPEQLEGKEADPRTDIFALGELLYEMATGKRAFTGSSKASLISAILSSEPVPISQVQPLTPPALEHVVRKCLNKDSDDRWQSAHDVASELKWISEQTSQSRMTAVPVKRKIPERAIWITLFALSLLTAAFFYQRSTLKPAGDLLRVSVLPQSKTQAAAISISPNGKMVVFGAQAKDGSISLYLRKLDSGVVKRLPGTDGASQWGIGWSPDGRSIAFGASGKLRKMDVNEGPPVTLADAVACRGVTWNRDGTILYAPNFSSSPIYRISAEGGKPTPVTQFDTAHQETSHRWPFFLPDGKHFLYAVYSNDQTSRGIYIGSLDSPDRKRILETYNFNAEYVDPGYLFYVQENNLVAKPFDPKTLKFSGEPVVISDKISFDGASYFFSTSPSGVIAYSDLDLLNVQLVWVGRTGNTLNIGAEGKGYLEPYLSPDEKKMVVGILDPIQGVNDLWIYEFARKTFTRFTFDTGSKYAAVWSPDGSTIVYAARRKGTYDLYQKSATGGTEDQQLLVTNQAKFADDWSKDGRYILFENEDPKTNYDLWVLPMFGDRKPAPYLQSQFNEAHARFSPDGKWVAYGSDEIGRTEIYIRAFPNASGGKWQVSTGGGDQPMWRGDGKELYYLGADSTMMAVDINAGETLDVGVPKPLFKTELPLGPLVGSERNFETVSQDGQRFLIKVPPADLSVTPISIIFNWTRLLKTPR